MSVPFYILYSFLHIGELESFVHEHGNFFLEELCGDYNKCCDFHIKKNRILKNAVTLTTRYLKGLSQEN